MLESEITYSCKKDTGRLCFQYKIGEIWLAPFLHIAHDSQFFMFKFGTEIFFDIRK